MHNAKSLYDALVRRTDRGRDEEGRLGVGERVESRKTHQKAVRRALHARTTGNATEEAEEAERMALKSFQSLGRLTCYQGHQQGNKLE